MKTKWLIMTVVAALAVTASLQADPINGTISFTGGDTLDTGNLGTATAITGYSSLSVLAGAESGSYAALNLGGANGQNGISALSFSTFSFALNVLDPNPLTPLWTVTYGGNVYSFVASSVFIATQNSTFLNLTGNGTAYINGVDATAGTWSITDTTGNAPTFTFGSGTEVPDGGMTAMLLGVGLSGLALLKRKLVA